MQTRGAVVRDTPGKWEVLDLDLDEPRQNEITVKVAACGLCHSEMHLAAGHQPIEHYPLCGGHEGAGVVVDVGPDTPGWAVGDHVVLMALPSCGRCRWCASGQSNLCDLTANLMSGARHDDKSYRLRHGDEEVSQFVGLSCFAEHTTVHVNQAVKIAEDLPLTKACLVGCAVQTGWGAATNFAEIKPGHTVIVMGCGGIGSFAVQGAAHMGATNVIACDPGAVKREVAEQIGATHSAAHIDEATEIAQSLTNGQGADSTVVAVGDLVVDNVAEALASIRKGGTAVVTGLGSHEDIGVPISMFDLTLSQKRLQGAMYGGMSGIADIPRLLNMYAHGQLKLDEVITAEYALEEINDGYAALEAGDNVRGVIVY